MRLRNLDSGPFHAPAIVEPTKVENGKETLGKVLYPAFVIPAGESVAPVDAEHERLLRAHHIIIARNKPSAEKLNGKHVQLLAWEGEAFGAENVRAASAKDARIAELEAQLSSRDDGSARKAAGAIATKDARIAELEAQLAAAKPDTKTDNNDSKKTR